MNAATRHVQRARERNGSGQLNVPLTLDAPFPALENLVSLAKRNPYAAIGAMITIAGIVITAVVGVAVSMFASVFMMYGTMNQTTAKLDMILKQTAEIQSRQVSDMNAVRAYEAAVQKQVSFYTGLMTKEQQDAVNGYDRAHPLPLLPSPEERK